MARYREVVAGVLVSGWNGVLWWMVWWFDIVSGWNLYGGWWWVEIVGGLNTEFSTPYSKWGRATIIVRSDTHAVFKPCFLGRYR